MKRVLFLMGIFAVVLLAVNNLHAFTLDGPQALDDWTENVFSGNFTSTTSGTQMQIEVNGSQVQGFGARVKKFSNGIGILATFNVSSVGVNMGVGLGWYLGSTAEGNLIHAAIWLQDWDGEKRITYQVSERTTDFQTIRTVSYGFLGHWFGGWTVDQNVTFGLARQGDDIYFYTPDNGAYVIVRPFQTMGIPDYPFGIWGQAPSGEENYCTATVSQVYIVYP